MSQIQSTGADVVTEDNDFKKITTIIAKPLCVFGTSSIINSFYFPKLKDSILGITLPMNMLYALINSGITLINESLSAYLIPNVVKDKIKEYKISKSLDLVSVLSAAIINMLFTNALQFYRTRRLLTLKGTMIYGALTGIGIITGDYVYDYLVSNLINNSLSSYYI